MPRKLRFLPRAHCLVEATVRTESCRFLLKPIPDVNDAILGVIGKAQEKYSMVIHSVVVLSDHVHYLISPKDTDQQARFFAFVNANVAKEVRRLVDPTSKGGHFWGRRYQAIVVSDEKASQLRRLEYHLSHGAKESLVEKPTDWPGVHAARALLGQEQLAGTWFNRSGFYRACQKRKPGEPAVDERDFKLRQTVQLSPLPCLAHLSEGQRRQVVREMLDQIEHRASVERSLRRVRVLGATKVQQQSIDMRPADPKTSLAPDVHASTDEVRRQLRDAYRVFSVAYYAAAAKLKGGDTTAQFPPGSFPPGLPYVPMAV